MDDMFEMVFQNCALYHPCWNADTTKISMLRAKCVATYPVVPQSALRGDSESLASSATTMAEMLLMGFLLKIM